MIETGLPGLHIEVSFDRVTINDKVQLIKPKHVSSNQWEQVWERMDKNYANNGEIEGGFIVVDLGEE